MSLWSRLRRKTDRAETHSEPPGDPSDVESAVTVVDASAHDDASPEAAPAGQGQDATAMPADGVAEDAVLDELSIVFADGPEPNRPVPVGKEPDVPVVVPDEPVADHPADDIAAPLAQVVQIEAEPADVEPVDDTVPPVERPVLIDPGLAPPSPASSPDTDAPGPGHTIQIGDEDLPEIRYLDEELGSSPGDDGPVIIDDDDTADAVVASDATGRSIDGRIRLRRIRVRRAAGRRRLQWVLIAAGVVVAIIAVLAVLASSLFSVNQITIVGNRYSDPDALKAVIVDLDGTPVLLVDTTAIEEDLEAIPWVEDARVRTSFPNAATIEIRERSPVAAMPGADGLTRVLDKDGRVLDLIDGQPIALVWISGPVTLDIPAGHFASPGPTWAAALVPKFTPTIRPRVESMQVTPDGSDLRLYLRPLSPAAAEPGGTDGTTPDEQPALLDGPLIEVRFGSAIGDNDQIAKLVRLERVLEDIGTKRVSVIDVSTAEVTVL